VSSATSVCYIREYGARSRKQRGTKEAVAVTGANKNNLEWGESVAPPDRTWYPNWRTAAEYEGYKDWSNRRWAWEFLRRNRSYRELCDKLRRSIGPGWSPFGI
jgi:Family of unknown function (DUF6499)